MQKVHYLQTNIITFKVFGILIIDVTLPIFSDNVQTTTSHTHTLSSQNGHYLSVNIQTINM